MSSGRLYHKCGICDILDHEHVVSNRQDSDAGSQCKIGFCLGLQLMIMILTIVHFVHLPYIYGGLDKLGTNVRWIEHSIERSIHLILGKVKVECKRRAITEQFPSQMPNRTVSINNAKQNSFHQ